MATKDSNMNIRNFSDYIIYVDESGDHGIGNINPKYPVFSLAFCIFNKADYAQVVTSKLLALKFKYWGHCDVVLHERDIRKSNTGDWSLLNNPDTRASFLGDISSLIQEIPFKVICSVIRKQEFSRYQLPSSPYEMAMLFCMERLNNWLLQNGQGGKITQIQFEARGRTEDKALELEFLRIQENASGLDRSVADFSQIDYHASFLEKTSNSTGLQIADLVVRPIGMNVFSPAARKSGF